MLHFSSDAFLPSFSKGTCPGSVSIIRASLLFLFLFSLSLAALGLRGYMQTFSLVAVSGDYSLVVVCKFLNPGASLVEHRL